MSKILSYESKFITKPLLLSIFSVFLLILGENIPVSKASQESDFKAGQAVARTLAPSAPSDPSLVPGYEGTSPREASLSHGELPEKAASRMREGDETAPGRALLEAEKTRPYYELDPKTDPLFQEGDRAVLDPQKTLSINGKRLDTQTPSQKTTHTCEESKTQTFTCRREISLTPGTQKRRVYLHSLESGWSFKHFQRQTMPGPASPEGRIYERWDGCNLWWTDRNHVWRYESRSYLRDLEGHAFEGPWQTMSKDAYESFQPTEPRAQWIHTCQILEDYADQGSCAYKGKAPLPGEVVRLLGGIPVTQHAWAEELTFECSAPSKNTCASLRDKGCGQTGSRCLQKIGDRCGVFEQTFECETQRSSLDRTAFERSSLDRTAFEGKAPFCLGGECVSQTWEKNQDLGEALSKLAVFQEIKKDMKAEAGLVFHGHAMACSKHCANFTDCCGVGSGWGISLGFSNCSDAEKLLSQLRAQEKCVFIGTTCAEKVLGVCLRKKSTFCCFGSRLAKLVHEEGRSQLGISWGEAEHPECRALTVDELIHIDFSKIDFTRAFGDLTQKVQSPDPSRVMGRLKEDFQKRLPSQGDLQKAPVPKSHSMPDQVKRRQQESEIQQGTFTLNHELKGDDHAELVF